MAESRLRDVGEATKILGITLLAIAAVFAVVGALGVVGWLIYAQLGIVPLYAYSAVAGLGGLWFFIYMLVRSAP